MKHLKLYKEQDIINICKKYDIQNYTINSDNSVDVDGNVRLHALNLNQIPLKFGKVTGTFTCSFNNLTSLIGCPYYVGGTFNCGNNKLTSLEGGPKEIGMILDFGFYNCATNDIWNFDGFPKISTDFYCDDNPIDEVWCLFFDLSKISMFQDYDIIRYNRIIILDRLNSFLEDIGNPTVDRVKGYKCI